MIPELCELASRLFINDLPIYSVTEIDDTTDYTTMLDKDIDDSLSTIKSVTSPYFTCFPKMIRVLYRWNLVDPIFVQELIEPIAIFEKLNEKALYSSFIESTTVWILLEAITRGFSIKTGPDEGFIGHPNSEIINAFIRNGDFLISTINNNNVDIFDFLNSIAFTRGLQTRKITTNQLLEKIFREEPIDLKKLPVLQDNIYSLERFEIIEKFKKFVVDKSAGDGNWVYSISSIDLTYPVFYAAGYTYRVMTKEITMNPLSCLISLMLKKYIDKFNLGNRKTKTGLPLGITEEGWTIHGLPQKHVATLLVSSTIAECYNKIRIVMRRGHIFIPDLNLKRASNGFLQKMSEFSQIPDNEKRIALHLILKDLVANMDFDSIFYFIQNLSQISNEETVQRQIITTLASITLIYDSVAGTSFFSVFC